MKAYAKAFVISLTIVTATALFVQRNRPNNLKQTTHQKDGLQTQFRHAHTLYKQKKIAASIAAYKKLLQHYSGCTTAHYNLGYILCEQGYISAAIPELETVVAQDPTLTQAHVCLAQAYLATGNYRDGWRELGWRSGKPGKLSAQVQALKKYRDTHKNLKGITILILGEWHLGDTMQFIRYARLLHRDGAIIVAKIQHALIPLLSLCPFIDTIIKPGDTRQPFHLAIPTVSLPLVFDTTIKTVPNHIPYLYANPDLVALWKKKLPQYGDTQQYKIGICWQGNTVWAATKFMPLRSFVQLADIPGVQLYSLQQYDGLEQLNTVPHNKLITFDKELDKEHGSFMDTAAIMKQLDLVITVDTSLAHLAGGLGVPVWLVLPRTAHWRWLLNRNDTPWYPTMRLFRQTKSGDWSDVIAAIKKGITTLLHNRN